MDRLEQETWSELDTLRSHPVERAELEKSKKKLRSSYLTSLQTHFFKGIVAGIYRIRAGDHEWINRIDTLYEAVTAHDVKDVAERYLTEDNRTVIHLVPVSPEDNEKWGEYE